MVNDADDGQVAGIGLAASGLTGRRAADADDPIAWYTANRIYGNLLGTAIENNLKMFVLKIRNAIGRNERLNNFTDQHLNVLLRW